MTVQKDLSTDYYLFNTKYTFSENFTHESHVNVIRPKIIISSKLQFILSLVNN